MDRRTVTDRLRDVEPAGTRASHPIYRMVDAAPKLCVEGAIQSRRSAANEKDYWDAQLKKQKFEENAGDLWRTDKVIVMLSEVLKLFREGVTIFVDNMEHESGLAQDQIDKVKSFSDNLLTSCRTQLLQLNADELQLDSEDDLGLGTNEDDFSDLGL